MSVLLPSASFSSSSELVIFLKCLDLLDFSKEPGSLKIQERKFTLFATKLWTKIPSESSAKRKVVSLVVAILIFLLFSELVLSLAKLLTKTETAEDNESSLRLTLVVESFDSPWSTSVSPEVLGKEYNLQ